jgi:predicted ATP-dependent protease
MVELLKTKQLYNKCDTSIFNFSNTNQIDSKLSFLGQERAYKAINTALDIKYEGYNLFVMGDSGTGRHTLVDKLLKEKSENEKAPDDWCYVNNFDDYTKPIIIKLPNKMGKVFKKDIQELIKSFQEKIPLTFKEKEYLKIKKEMEEESKKEQNIIFYKLKEEAKKENIFINDTTVGITISALKNGKPLSSEEFQDMNIKEREELEKKIIFYKQKVDENAKLELQIAKRYMDKMKKIDDEYIHEVVSKLIEPLSKKYKEFPKITNYLEKIKEDVVDNFEDFISDDLPQTGNNIENLLTQNLTTVPSYEMYNVNLFVDNCELDSAPIIYDHNPTYSNLFGRIEHVSHMGTVSTDFNLLKAGSLHKANGGYLVLDANSLLFQPYAWEGLKRMLLTKKIYLETLEESMGFTSVITLSPESIELDAKIVLIGSSFIYYLLYENDDDFKRLFKIEADFEEKTQRDEKNMLLYANILSTLVKKYQLLPLTKKAVGRIIEFSSRLVDDSNNLSTDFSAITDLLQESNYMAQQRNSKYIKNDDILEALRQREYRSQRIKDEVYKQINDGIIQINTNGEKVGQINGLSVLDFGRFVFSMPVKISALTRVGRQGIVDIEREVDLSGSIHSKGVMILAAYLASKYSHDFSMSLSASLVFEQSYSIVDGDSASLAELYTLLSSISNIPIKQNFAVTGSINQNGEVQAIGGVNEKIEGFFDVCKLKEKDFQANVIIPHSNIKNLMLKEEVLRAVKSGQFKVYAIKHVDEGIKLLMDIKAGTRGINGKFTKNSLNYIVEEKLLEFSSLSQKTPTKK